MKKRTGIDRAVDQVASVDLHRMPTKALLARLARLRACEESLAASDLSPGEVEQVAGILFKSSPKWLKAFAEIKEALATREHLPRSIAKARGKEPEPRSFLGVPRPPEGCAFRQANLQVTGACCKLTPNPSFKRTRLRRSA